VITGEAGLERPPNRVDAAAGPAIAYIP